MAQKQKDSSKKNSWREWLGEGQFGKRLSVVIIFFIVLGLFLHFREVRIAVIEQGSVAQRYIIAHVDFEFPDEEETLVIKHQAVGDIGTIYRINEKQLRKIRFDFESYLLTRQDWRNQLKQTTFNELYRGADALVAALAKAHFTNPRTLQKLKEYDISTENYYLFSRESIVGTVLLPKSFWKKIQENVFVSGNFHPETANFILESFEGQSWNLQEDVSAERALKQIVQDKVPNQYTSISAGEHLIDPGEKVTSRHLAMLQAMKDSIGKDRNLFTIRTITEAFYSLSFLQFSVFSILK